METDTVTVITTSNSCIMAFQGVWDLYPEGGIMVPEGEARGFPLYHTKGTNPYTPISHDTNHLYHS